MKGFLFSFASAVPATISTPRTSSNASASQRGQTSSGPHAGMPGFR